MTNLLRHNALFELLDELRVLRVSQVTESTIIADLEAITPEDDIEVSDAFWAT